MIPLLFIPETFKNQRGNSAESGGGIMSRPNPEAPVLLVKAVIVVFFVQKRP